MDERTCDVPGCVKPKAKGRTEYCGMHYFRLWRTGTLELIPRPKCGDSACSVDGCPRRARYRNGLCANHNEAARRYNGDPLGRYVPALRTMTQDGYVMLVVEAGSHPLAANRKLFKANRMRLLEHRVVLFDRIGPGEHPCTWCGTLVTWDEAWPASPRALVGDHVNGVRHDNRPENVVASCMPCNVARGQSSA